MSRLTLCDGSVVEMLPGEESGGVWASGVFHRHGCPCKLFRLPAGSPDPTALDRVIALALAEQGGEPN